MSLGNAGPADQKRDNMNFTNARLSTTALSQHPGSDSGFESTNINFMPLSTSLAWTVMSPLVSTFPLCPQTFEMCGVKPISVNSLLSPPKPYLKCEELFSINFTTSSLSKLYLKCEELSLLVLFHCSLLKHYLKCEELFCINSLLSPQTITEIQRAL